MSAANVSTVPATESHHIMQRKGDDLEPPLHTNISNMIRKFGLITQQDQNRKGEEEKEENNESGCLICVFFFFSFLRFLLRNSPGYYE